MRRSITKAMSLVACVALLGAFRSTAVLADESEDARYNAQRETNDLLDREKLLQKQEEELNRSIYETKQKIKYLADDLDAQVGEQSRIRPVRSAKGEHGPEVESRQFLDHLVSRQVLTSGVFAEIRQRKTMTVA